MFALKSLKFSGEKGEKFRKEHMFYKEIRKIELVFFDKGFLYIVYKKEARK